MNKKIIKFALPCIAALLTSCGTKDIVIDDFESGTFDKWKVEGDAFGNTPSNGAYTGQQAVSDFQGKYLANSFNGGDDSRGILESNSFKIEKDYINFLLGGGIRPDAYIELVVDGQSIYKTRPVVESETLHMMTWNVADYKGKDAVIKIVDNQRGDWGHVLVDEIVMSDTEKSNIMPEYKMPFEASMKYLLVPIEDKGPETTVQLSVNGQPIGEPMHIRIAQTKIDYWVPIHIEEFKGKPITLTMDHVKKTDIGFSQIKQSDTFDFDYNEKYRPTYHFSPQYGWMNDPNGMVYNDGEYHLYYQHNPYGSRWSNMNWGHAVSKDLVKWEYQPEAIAPDSLGSIFSGSAIIDKHNTAGFGENTLIAIYTSAGKVQSQSIAYSTDNGRTFTKYDQNPVLSDPKIVDFRDPKVFWHNKSNQWVMSLATSQTISFYGSKNLKQWEKLSEFGEGIGDHGGVWECPDLFPLRYNGQDKWVLLVSINPGGPNGGSATQYFLGDFDGKNFKPDMSLPYPIWIDYGRDNYAGVSWSNIPETDGRRLFIGWMSNWDYANFVPTINFRSASTLPRELKISNNGKHLVLADYPVKEIDQLRGTAETFDDAKIDKNFTIDRLLKDNKGAYELSMTIDANGAESFEFALQNKMNEKIRFVFDLKNENMYVDRSASGKIDFSDNFGSKEIKAPLVKKDIYTIRLFVDKASTELFINEGELTQTNIVFPTEPYNTLSFESNGTINVKDIKVYNLNK